MSDNDALQRFVLAELAWDPSIAASHIGAAVTNGLVTLSGHVDSFLHKNAAEDAARRLKGVIKELVSQRAYDTALGNNDIAKAAVGQPVRDTVVPRYTVRVKVEHGRLIRPAPSDVRHLASVMGLSGPALIRPAVNTRDIFDNTMAASYRSCFFNPRTATVMSERDRVRLSGIEDSPNE